MSKSSLKQMLGNIAVPLLFVVIISIAIPLSKYSGAYLLSEIITRLTRNLFLVLSLLLPVMAGMGINFGMILGAMAGQVGLIFVTEWGLLGATGLLVAAAVGTPIAILLGYFAGNVLNRAKGREMITSMMLGLFVSGIYQFFLLYLCGDIKVMPISIIPFKNSNIVLSRGYGIKNAINLDVAGGFDKLLVGKLYIGGMVINVPIGTFMIIGLIAIFSLWIRRTKLGQEMRAVGQDMSTSESSGINVKKVRIYSIIISTVLACYGQIIYLQNISTLNTYNGADQAALFSAAALLIGGATVSKASITNGIVGTILFHLMFIVMPTAGQTLTGQAMLGEYLRMFISYGVVTTALVLHAWKRENDKNMEREKLGLGLAKGAEAK